MRTPALRGLLRRAVVVALAAAIAALAWPRAPGMPGGEPRPASWLARIMVHTLHNPGFEIGYSEWRRDPLWVAFRAQAPGDAPIGRRPDFSIDERTFMHVRSEDYSRSGYDRGHMAPNYLIAKLYGADAQRATFLMSNVVPQRHRLNVLVWQRLEEAEADLVAPRMGEMWVVTGPVFAAQPKSLRSGIAVPEAFYRIWLAPLPSGREPRALAFLVPQEVCGTEPLSRYLASVDAIEERTGLDFFPELDAAAQARIEAGVESDGWELQRWERQPPRYAKEFRKLDCRESGAVDAAGIGRTR